MSKRNTTFRIAFITLLLLTSVAVFAQEDNGSSTTPEVANVILDQGTTIVWVFIGIIISIILPVVVRTLRQANTSLESNDRGRSLMDWIKKVWIEYGGNRYTIWAVAAFILAAILVFLLELEFTTARDAAFAGFAWESLVNKLFGGPPDSDQ